MPNIIESLGPHSLLILLMGVSVVGLLQALHGIVRPHSRAKGNNPIIAIIILIAFGNIVLFFSQGPIPERYLREFYSLSALFAASGMIVMARTLPKMAIMGMITITIAIGLIGLVNAFARYERSITVDWEYLSLYRWLEANATSNATVASDAFTIFSLAAAVPFVQGTSIPQTVAETLPKGFDPLAIILSGNQTGMARAFSILCPDYIVIDRAITGQSYPITAQDHPEQLSGYATIVYTKRMSRTWITVFKTLDGACQKTPFRSSLLFTQL